jgi:Trk K+ transport system NAD-binding subunit
VVAEELLQEKFPFCVIEHDREQEETLREAGYLYVVETCKLSAMKVIQSVVRPTVNEFIELVGDRGQLSLIMEEVTVSPNSTLIGARCRMLVCGPPTASLSSRSKRPEGIWSSIRRAL